MAVSDLSLTKAKTPKETLLYQGSGVPGRDILTQWNPDRSAEIFMRGSGSFIKLDEVNEARRKRRILIIEAEQWWRGWLISLAGAARMVGHWPENDCGEEDEYISGRLRQEETEQQDWSPLGKTKAGAKSALPPIIFSGLIRWEADLGPCGFCATTLQCINKVSDHQNGICWL